MGRRRLYLGAREGAVLAALLLAPAASAMAGEPREAAAPARRTVLEVRDDEFRLNGTPTYAGRVWDGRSIEGLLLNSRMVQGIFDDENADTRGLWAYPDTGRWDPERNTTEFVASMPEWRAHGLLAFTLNLQGGGPLYGKPFPYDQYLNSAYDSRGGLKPASVARLRRVLERADQLGMVVILGLSYFGMDHRFLESPEACQRLSDEVIDHLGAHNDRNVIIEVANERTFVATKTGRVPAVDLIQRMRARARGAYKDGYVPPLTTSHAGGGGLPSREILLAVDVVLLHGNNQSPAQHVAMVRRTRELLAETRGSPKAAPIVFNEAGPWSDYEHMEAWMEAFKECVRQRVSWGYFDQGDGRVEGGRRTGPVYEKGYQTPPVRWGINTPEKKLFFGTLREITGAPGGGC